MVTITRPRLQSKCKTTTTVLIFALFASIPSASQLKLPDLLTGHLKKNKNYERVYESSIDISELKNGSSGFNWKVWSDRDNNQLYTSPKKKSIAYTANFKEEFLVFDVKKDSKGEIFLKIKSLSVSSSQKEGWIPIKKTLASSKAMASKIGLTRKFMILAPVESIKEEKSLDVIFYNTPEQSGAEPHFSDFPRFTIQFALKEENGMILLCTSNDFDQGEAGWKAKISGWIPKSSLTEWNSRVGYAPNHVSAFDKYFNNSLPVHSTKYQAEHSWTTNTQTEDLTSYSIADTMPDNWNVAFPPMPSIPGEISDTTAFAKQLREVVVLVCAGDEASCEEGYNGNRAELEELRRQLRQLNVYFILDGTNSMSPFVRSAKTAIEEIIKSFDDKAKDYIKVGYTVYRDYPDGKDAVVSTEPNSDFKEFSKEIERLKCFSQAPTRSEAFYQGLIEGIKSAKFNDNLAQNLLVIIGDAGNHIDDALSLEDVEAELDGKKITLFALQTKNGAHPSYMDFNQDMLKLASNGSPSGSWVEESESKFTFKSSNSEEIAAWETESSVYIGNAKGEPTDPAKMSDDIVKAIQRLNDKREMNTAQLYLAEMTGNQFPPASGITTTMGAIPTSTRGYINTQPTSNETAAYIPYVFLTQDEYTKLQYAFRVFEEGFAAAAIKDFTAALLQTLGAITGDADNLQSGPLHKVILEKSLNEIWNEYLQVPCELPFANSKLVDLEDEYSKSDKNEWEDAMEQFLRQVTNFVDNSDESKNVWSPILSADEPFYWLPFSMFPGAE